VKELHWFLSEKQVQSEDYYSRCRCEVKVRSKRDQILHSNCCDGQKLEVVFLLTCSSCVLTVLLQVVVALPAIRLLRLLEISPPR